MNKVKRPTKPDEVPVRYCISSFEAAVLIWALYQGEPDVSANTTLAELVDRLEGNRTYVSKEELEGALYAANLQAEAGLFFHPLNRSFEQFCYKLLPMDRVFNREYNLIERKENE